MIKYLKVFSDETRLRLLRLCCGDEMNVHELTNVLDMAQPRVSNHLRLLREAGLLTDRREGTWSYYRMPASEKLPAQARPLWEQALAWMNAGSFFPEDVKRRDDILRARQAPAQEYFETVGADWDEIGLRLVDESMRERLLLNLLPANLVVADVGSGSGRFLGLLSPHVKKAIGVEPSSKMLEVSRENIRQNGWANVEIRRGSLEELPLKEAEIDAAFCNLVLHHSPRPAEAVARLAAALKPGGKIVISDFAAHQADWMREEMADFWLGFEPEALREWLQSAGFEKIIDHRLGQATVSRAKPGHPTAELSVLSFSAQKKQQGNQSLGN